MRAAAFLFLFTFACSADSDLVSLSDAGVRDVTNQAETSSEMNDTSVVDAGPCSKDMAAITIDSGLFCVDLYEGAIAEGDGGALWPHEYSIDDADASDLHAVVAKGVVPQGYISQIQATQMCAQSGKRLCTLDEWTAACRGQPEHDYLYPYGDTYEDVACNEGKPSPIVELFGPDPTYDNTELEDPRCDELEGGVAPGGAYAKCVSFYGAFDMHGNLHEWIDDTPNGGNNNGSFMGGYFVDAKLNGAGCTYRTTAHAKSYHDYSTGFRCCSDARQ